MVEDSPNYTAYLNHYNKQIFRHDKFLVLLLLVVSGNPVFHAQKWAAPSGYVIVAIFLFIIYYKSLTKKFLKKLIIFIYGFLFIFIIQNFNLGYVSIIFTFGFATKIVLGALVYHILDRRFASVFFDVLVKICLISFPFYLIHLYLGDNALSNFFLNGNSVGVYTFRPQTPGESFLHNSGMFWEPGAFQAFINLCLFMNFGRMPFLLKRRKIGLLIIILALASTQSTTGYITFSLLIFSYFLFYAKVNKTVLIIILVTISIVSIYSYYTLDFLGSKVDKELGYAQEAGGEFNNTRFGSLLFDLHYIKKNPFTGNGFQPITRFADHPIERAAEERGENLGHGNGFSGFIASAGILGMFWYMFTIVYFREVGTVKNAFLLCFLMIFLLQGEYFLIFPFFISFPFLKFTNSDETDVSSNYYMLQ